MPPEFDLDNLFTYHPVKEGQCERYVEIREAAKAFAAVVVGCCPASADKTAAIRKIREAMMTANAAIACNE
jgi:hypothetical protein